MKICAQCSQKVTNQYAPPRQNLDRCVEFHDGCDKLDEIREAGVLLRPGNDSNIFYKKYREKTRAICGISQSDCSSRSLLSILRRKFVTLSFLLTVSTTLWSQKRDVDRIAQVS